MNPAIAYAVLVWLRASLTSQIPLTSRRWEESGTRNVESVLDAYIHRVSIFVWVPTYILILWYVERSEVQSLFKGINTIIIMVVYASTLQKLHVHMYIPLTLKDKYCTYVM